MTHSLHRVRMVNEDIDDFVFLCTPAIGFNHDNCAENLIKILDILIELEPENINFYEADSTGFDIEKIKESINDKSRLRCCFSKQNQVIRLLNVLKLRDFGLSVVISGRPDKIEDILKLTDIKPHTINIAAGFYGKTHKLPSHDVLSLLTMCGHGLIAQNLIKDRIQKVKNGEITIKEAIDDIGTPCTCGIFNPARARSIFQKMITDI